MSGVCIRRRCAEMAPPVLDPRNLEAPDGFWLGCWGGGRGSCTAGLQNTLTQQMLLPLQACVSAGWSGWSRGQLGLPPSPGTGSASPGPPALPAEILTACLPLSTLVSLNTQQAERSHGGVQKGIFPS